MRLKFRVLAVVLAASLVALTALSAGPAYAAGGVIDTPAVPTVPVTGVVEGGGGTFAGTFAPHQFAADHDQLMAAGTLDGTLTDATGNARTVSGVPATFPVAVAQATCTVLDLNLGGIALNVLGLLVQLDPIHLNISAEQGGLIGTLLCLIASLLGSGAPSSAAVDPLNRMLPLM
jgi:hypothetical protein